MQSCAYGVKAIPDALKTNVSKMRFQELARNPKAAIGRTVLLGGTIIETINHKEGTRLEILQKPLDYEDRPLSGDESYGRFMIEQAGEFLDPAVYEKGRELTLVGKITEERTKRIGGLDYRYPYIVVSYLHLWKKRTEYAKTINTFPDYYRSPYWFGSYPYNAYPYEPYYPYWGNPFGPFPYPQPPLHKNKLDQDK